MRLDRLSNALRLAEAGYDGYSMSNNARAAYDAGRMPMSKWTKESILSGLKEEYGDSLSSELYNYIKKLPLGFLRKYFLRRTEWHHTSSMYNATDFYGVDDNYLDNAEDTDGSIKQLEDDYAKWKEEYDKDRVKKKAEKESKGDFCYFKYLVWGGSRAHPRAYEEESYGYVKGDWIYFANEDGKLTSGKKGFYSNGTEIIKYLEPGEKYVKPAPPPKVRTKRVKREFNPYENYTEDSYKWNQEHNIGFGIKIIDTPDGYIIDVPEDYYLSIIIKGIWSKPIKSVNSGVKLIALSGRELSTCPQYIEGDLVSYNYGGEEYKLGYAHVKGDMIIGNSPNLKSLEGLPHVDGEIQIYGCPNITDDVIDRANEVYGEKVVRR